MEFHFAPSNVPKFIFLLALLIVTTNAQNDNLFSNICPKTKNPNSCLSLLKHDSRTNKATSVQTLGIGSLSMAMDQSILSMNLLDNLVRKTFLPDKEMYSYLNCRNYYKFALAKLSDAKKEFGGNKFSSARRNVAVVVKAAATCRRIGSPPPGIKSAIDMSETMFNIAYVIMQEADGKKI
ncbi:PREDICTED: pectinesterase inhibitor-like [Erythranthe guttata]|uniref:pectinesterase inhibitor-like n=1 Tax=Erythranthe guttata TaxID=4155 RepID=UPI00064DC0F5|nr:PREDICTED: pectinesterase inhibitor-like [Erythranthe guttata]|eukprot:XP_012834078.1 PREDICTED: pectinesterase inhibitor-like [Erythranthe guttata]